MECSEKKSWFAMSATYRRELKVKQILDKLNIENFVPTYLKTCVRNGVKKEDFVPIIHNLIFVYCEFKELQEIKNRLSYFQFMTNYIDGKRRPIIIRDKDMQNFIGIIQTHNETQKDKIEVLADNQINIKKGTKVKIVGGPLHGREGKLVKVKGRRNRCFVVSLEDSMNFVIPSISLSMLEIIQ